MVRYPSDLYLQRKMQVCPFHMASRSAGMCGSRGGKKLGDGVCWPVPPGRRRHVIGPRGDTVQKLRKDFPNVARDGAPATRIAPPSTSASKGPKSQVAAAAKDITGRLEVIEAQLREAAERRKKNRVKVVVDVAPNTRHHLVGPGGEQGHQAGSENTPA
ncbi:hypothetical protein GWK47_031297 [Chionoecetes opilio]|uniref:K Homology domain-containing protein n=1 Tax=Chionoecetes opilio TaxID=41210 RepID=A0A8J4YL39_CHIOP|nr:hypothetical protein GWK47_031297 [Chionoecetes opilio]